MKEPIEMTLFWMIICLILSIIAHFSGKFFLKKYNIQKMKIEKFKKDNPNKSFSFEENFNEHMTKSYANSLLLVRYVFIIGAILIFLRSFFD